MQCKPVHDLEIRVNKAMSSSEEQEATNKEVSKGLQIKEHDIQSLYSRRY